MTHRCHLFRKANILFFFFIYSVELPHSWCKSKYQPTKPFKCWDESCW